MRVFLPILIIVGLLICGCSSDNESDVTPVKTWPLITPIDKQPEPTPKIESPQIDMSEYITIEFVELPADTLWIHGVQQTTGHGFLITNTSDEAVDGSFGVKYYDADGYYLEWFSYDLSQCKWGYGPHCGSPQIYYMCMNCDKRFLMPQEKTVCHVPATLDNWDSYEITGLHATKWTGSIKHTNYGVPAKTLEWSYPEVVLT